MGEGQVAEEGHAGTRAASVQGREGKGLLSPRSGSVSQHPWGFCSQTSCHPWSSSVCTGWGGSPPLSCLFLAILPELPPLFLLSRPDRDFALQGLLQNEEIGEAVAGFGRFQIRGESSSLLPRPQHCEAPEQHPPVSRDLAFRWQSLQEPGPKREKAVCQEPWMEQTHLREPEGGQGAEGVPPRGEHRPLHCPRGVGMEVSLESCRVLSMPAAIINADNRKLSGACQSGWHC